MSDIYGASNDNNNSLKSDSKEIVIKIEDEVVEKNPSKTLEKECNLLSIGRYNRKEGSSVADN